MLTLITAQDAATRTLYLDTAAEQETQAGTRDSYETLESAIADFRQGDRLVIAPGVYRGTIKLAGKAWRGNAQTTIEAALPGTVLIKGSVIVNGWDAEGDGVFVRKDWYINSQQVFIDGVPLTQIGGNVFNGYPDDPGHPLHRLHKGRGIWPGRLNPDFTRAGPGSFFYDAARHALYIKMSKNFAPASHEIEVSIQDHLIYAETNGLTVRGLRFEHSNTTAHDRSGALTLKGDHNLLENVHVQNVDGSGMAIVGNDVTVIDSSANYCGRLGMSARGERIHILNVETSYNNTRGFNKWWEAGGAKFVGNMGLQNSVVSDHVAIGNHGDGLWFDWGNRGNRIQGCFCAYNSGHGIHYEASSFAYITNNIVVGNRQRGIYLPHSSDCVVAHNLIVNNVLGAVVSVDTGRRDPEDKLSLSVRNIRNFGNVLAWNAFERPSVIIGLQANGNSSNHNLYVEDEPGSTNWSTGFRQSPRSFKSWVNATGHDTASSVLVASPPASLLEAIRNREKIVDWRSLPVLGNTRNYSYKLCEDVPGLGRASGVQVSPGPLSP